MTTGLVKREEKWMRPPAKPEPLGLARFDKVLLHSINAFGNACGWRIVISPAAGHVALVAFSSRV